jgi:6-phosphofructokinase 1
VEQGEVDPAHLKCADFEVDRLEGCAYENPLTQVKREWVRSGIIYDDERRIMFDPRVDAATTTESGPATSVSPFTMRLAAPRLKIHFDPSKTVVGIVTCGGVCPGLNDVVRGLTYACLTNYHVKRVVGFRYGFWGLSAAGRDAAITLTTDVVSNVHRVGGTFLGTSRGPQKPHEMVDTLLQYGVNILFCVGGDGTQRGAIAIGREARKRGLDIAVMGVPKTIDNDLSFSHRTFGFETAVEQAVHSVKCAHAEAVSAQYGIGLVKVMGRHSGFIAAQATVSSGLVNLCFVPENPVSLEQVLQLVASRFAVSSFCVICIAEGFGQDWIQSSGDKDASGNTKLVDIGAYLSKELSKWMKKHPKFKSGTVKYIDPSYIVRATPPSPSDAAFCVHLANLAVHEAMAGVTNSVISYWYSNFIVIPTRLATSLRKVVSLRGQLWRQVREVTGDIISEADIVERRRETLKRQIRAAGETQERLKIALAKL